MILKLLLTFAIIVIVAVLSAILFNFASDVQPLPEDETRKKRSKLVALVKCCGKDRTSEKKYEYKGDLNCASAAELFGGEKLCTRACIGYGNCAKVCDTGALEVKNGVAIVNKSKCNGCGKCVDACPKKLISLVLRRSKVHILCDAFCEENTEHECKTGCISCLKCVAKCPRDAIVQKDGMISINYNLCDNCGDCVKICPVRSIREQKN